MDREEGDRFRQYDATQRPGELPDAEESAAEGGGSQGAADLGARGSRDGGSHGTGELDDPRDAA